MKQVIKKKAGGEKAAGKMKIKDIDLNKESVKNLSEKDIKDVKGGRPWPKCTKFNTGC